MNHHFLQVLFSDSALQKISKAGKDEALSEEQRENALKLAAVVDLINQVINTKEMTEKTELPIFASA